MNFAEILFIFLMPLILFGVVWILGKPLTAETSLDPGDTIEDLLPLHTQYYPQLRWSLDSADARYVRRRVSKEAERSWSAERRQIVRDYLTGLEGDFARVLHLAGIVDSLSPRVSKRTRLQRTWLALRFRILYRATLVCISTGSPGVLRQAARLAGYVGNLSALEEAAMARLEIMSSGEEVHSNFSA
jgi:hypothetical protein